MILVGFGLIWHDFGWIMVDFGFIVALIALTALYEVLGGPRRSYDFLGPPMHS